MTAFLMRPLGAAIVGGIVAFGVGIGFAWWMS